MMENRREEYHLQLNGQNLLVEMSREKSNEDHAYHSGRHCHGRYELHLILKGSIQINIEDQRLQVGQGEALLLFPGVYHQGFSDTAPFRRLVLSFFLEKGHLSRMLSGRGRPFRQFRFNEETEAICRLLRDEDAHRGLFHKELQQSLLCQLLVRVFRLLEVSQELSAVTEKEEYRLSLIDQIDRYFEYHYMERGGMPELAKSLRLSCRQLGRILEEHYGMGFQERITSERMDRAAQLLRDTDVTVSKIAGTVGYGSETTFFQNFRKWFSMTPQQYRKQNRGES